MFLVNHSLEIRAHELRSWLNKLPSVALVVAAAYFEWTVYRAVTALSRRSNVEIREELRRIYGLEKYKDLWRDELGYLTDAKKLPEVVTDWHGVTVAFDARNRLIHGRTRYTRKMATPAIRSNSTAVSDVVAYCRTHNTVQGRLISLLICPIDQVRRETQLRPV